MALGREVIFIAKALAAMQTKTGKGHNGITIPVESEIMPSAGEIEAFVAQRKIGDAVFTYGEGETLSVEE